MHSDLSKSEILLKYGFHFNMAHDRHIHVAERPHRRYKSFPSLISIHFHYIHINAARVSEIPPQWLNHSQKDTSSESTAVDPMATTR
jgi:hypothetical protein